VVNQFADAAVYFGTAGVTVEQAALFPSHPTETAVLTVRVPQGEITTAGGAGGRGVVNTAGGPGWRGQINTAGGPGGRGLVNTAGEAGEDAEGGGEYTGGVGEGAYTGGGGGDTLGGGEQTEGGLGQNTEGEGKRVEFTLQLRVPGWAVSSANSVRINGTPYAGVPIYI